MNWKKAIERWRKLPQAEQQRLRRSRIPAQVARSMAFEGEPVNQEMLEAELKRRPVPPAT